MKHVLIVLVLPWFLLGCSASSDRLTDSQKAAIRCAENWRKQGLTFDPNSMTCSQMFERVQDIRRGAYWAEQGHYFDPNLMTSQEMDRKVEDIKRAEYWKHERGYSFDPNFMSAEEMDDKAEELQKAAFWQQKGYYYDANSQKVFLDRAMRTELSSLAGLHGGYEGATYFQPTVSSESISGGLPESASRSYESTSKSGIYPNTGGGHWVKKKMNRGRFILLDDRSLWAINPVDRINSGLWLPVEEIVVTASANPRYPYRLINADSSNTVEATLISTSSTHWISENIDSGRFLKLQDDSLWEVSSTDTVDSALWLSLSQVVVTEGQNPAYPYLLINTDDGAAVEAKLVGM